MDDNVTVLIVGGGPTGLTLSILLSDLGIDSLLIEEDAGTCDHPQGHVINTRTAEVMRSVSLERSIHERADVSAGGSIWFVTSIAGDALACLDPGADKSRRAARAAMSPSFGTSCPQDIIEPLLAEKAAQGPGRINFSSQLVGLQQDGDGVIADVVCQGETRQIRSRWLVGCDGATSPTRKLLGIMMDGPEALAHVVGIYFHADLSKWTAQRSGLLYWTIDAECPATIINLGEGRWTAHIGWGGDRQSLETFTVERCAEIVQHIVGDEVDVDVRSVRPWTMTAQIASTYRQGNVLIAGDAAHRFPPTGGFGMNTGIQDAHNLAWKLAAIEQGWAGETLLDSYESERKPVAMANSDFSVRNATGMAAVMGRGAMAQGQRLAAGEVSVQGLTGEIQTLLDAEAGHFDASGRDLGFLYEVGALIPDGTSAPTVENPDRDYVPCARPGARAPHLWLQRKDSDERVSTLDLFNHQFTVLTTTDQAPRWQNACASTTVPITVVPIGDNITDPSGTWQTLYGVADGAVLIRPDGHVAWRARDAVEDPAATLTQVLATILSLSDEPEDAT